MRFDTQAQQIAAHYRVNFRIVNRLFITVFKTAARMTHMMTAVGKALTRRAKTVSRSTPFRNVMRGTYQLLAIPCMLRPGGSWLA